MQNKYNSKHMGKSIAKKILILEDEKPMAKALVLKLEHCGFTAQSVGNGDDALKLIEKEKFDLILCDLIMPKMDGFTFLEKLKNKNLGIPVIVLSNLSQEVDEKKARDLGARDFFIKSNTPIADIVEHVKKVLNN